jgi:sterol desaturase/sphingolipid hydroxylase (fatty acid hydroxylase superfamily)
MEAIINLSIPVIFVLALVLERVFPARELPKVRGWLFKGIVFFMVAGLFNGLVPPILASLLGPYAPWSIASLGTLGAVVVSILVTDFAAYWVHRFMHRYQPVWRWTHQVHHSAERMDMAGFAFFHPFDMVISIGSTTVVAILIGATAEAAMIAGFASFLMGVFQHMNIKTPAVIGYLVQRPENHSVHHERGVHAYNYGNLSIWDMAFGTFRNAREFSAQAGFWDGASSKMGAMLIGRDVGAPAA